MTSTQKIIWTVVAVAVLGGLYWWWQSSQSPAMSDDGTSMAVDMADDSGAQQVVATSTTQTTSSAATSTNIPTSASVTYDGSTFSPSSVTIKQGGTVTFTSTAGNMWVASDPHPVHTGYDGTDRQTHCAAGYSGAAPFDQCSPGTSWSFTFNKVGTWGYHNHLNESVQGTVIVQAQ